ncbi:MAG: hypothetical protein GPOALKHO_000651 [Sodalis sp.]|nr:MAG: hypothetical protein GPOALKHO_000651 [Sodalis sp.]
MKLVRCGKASHEKPGVSDEEQAASLTNWHGQGLSDDSLQRPRARA